MRDTKAEVLDYVSNNPGCSFRDIYHALKGGQLRDYLADYCKAGTMTFKLVKNPDTGHKIKTYYMENWKMVVSERKPIEGEVEPVKCHFCRRWATHRENGMPLCDEHNGRGMPVLAGNWIKGWW